MEAKNSFDTLDIFVYLWKKRKSIIIVTILGAIISIIVSLLLQNYYKAQTILFPSTFISPSTSLLHKNVNQETDPLLLGDEDDLEKMIQMLQSDYITNRIIEKYNLIEHYGLKPDDPHLKTKLKKLYTGNITFKKTHYQAAVITVVDADPQYSANIANDIAELLDSLAFQMQKQKALDAYNIAYKAYIDEKNYLQILEDSLDLYRQKGILDYYKEVERYGEAYAKGYANNTMTAKREKMFQAKFDTLKKYGGQVRFLTNIAKKVAVNVADLHINYTQAKQNLEAPYTRKYVISKAEVPDKKAFPKRSLIVIFSTFASFVFAIVMILLLDFYKEFRKRIAK
jgi:uncharacterized protein involved in exopolysaccharide biosynthesis